MFFVWFDSLHPSQQYFSYVGTGLPGLNQYCARTWANVSVIMKRVWVTSDLKSVFISLLCGWSVAYCAGIFKLSDHCLALPPSGSYLC